MSIKPKEAVGAKRYLLSGDMAFLTEEGDVYTIDDLAGDFYSNLNVLALDQYGRLSTTVIHSFEPEKAITSGTTMTFMSGLTLTLPNEVSLLSPARDLLKVKDLEFGSLVSGAIYDSTKPCPSYSTDEILHIHATSFEEPETLFGFWSSDSAKDILITRKWDNTRTCPLVSVATLNDSNVLS